MRKEELTADVISVEKPCSESWDEMSGNEKTRACSHCSEKVNDISMMTESEAFDLIKKSNGNLCVRYEAHPVTNAPIFADKLYQITRQTGVAAGVLGATLAVTTSVDAQKTNPSSSLNNSETTISSVKNSGTKRIKIKQPKVSPTPPKKPIRHRIMGEIRIRNWIRNPLMQAVNRGQNLKVRLMIAQGADVNAVDNRYYSRTALHVAVERNNVKMAQILINAGVSLETQDKYKNTPLMNLRWSTSPEMIKLLAQNGANVNAKNQSGQTALMNAARSGNLKAVKALLDSGADVAIRDNYKNSALDMARVKEIKELLIIYGAEERVLSDKM